MDTTCDLASIEVLPLETTPDKSDHRYQKTYETFVKWQESNGITSFDEDVLLTYFNEASTTLKSSSLWSMYSMLKRTIGRNNNIDISSYRRVTSFLKEKSVGFEKKKCKVFSAEEIQRFLVEAPDEHYLAMKTIMVFGVTGGCRSQELTTVKTDHVTDYGTEMIVNIPETKKNIAKVFVISGEFAKIVQKYMQLRPARVETDRFFLQYSQGECDSQVIGKNKIAIVPKEIAKFLQLDEYKSYTGHSFQPKNFENRRRRWKPAQITDIQNLQTNSLRTSDASNRLAAVYMNTDSIPDNITIKTECNETDAPTIAGNVFYEITTFNDHQTATNCQPAVIPMLPGTVALMKRKSEFYMGFQPNRFLRLLQLAAEMKLLSDLKLMLALRKLRLNEDFEVLGDLFDLDKSTTERYYHESKRIVIDLVNRLATTTTNTSPIISNNCNVIFEPIIKIEKCDSPYAPDPIAVDAEHCDSSYNPEPLTADNDDSSTDMNAYDQNDQNDQNDFETNFPGVSSNDERGWLSDDIRKRTAECTVCHKFYVPRLLNSHMEIVHFNLGNLNRTICGLCWKEFGTETLLKSHQKVAHGGGSHGCDICKKTFASKRYLSVHILSRHTEVKTYLCDTCGEGFPVPFSLQDHVKRKHMKRGHDCHLCDMKFVTSAALNDHFVARHTDERRFTCDFKGCGKTFKWRSSFKSHRRVHANDKYECSVCMKRFSFKGNLRNHLKTIHNQIVDNQCLISNII